MVTEILLPTFRRVIPVCRKVFRQETRAYTGWPIWEGEVEERRREGEKRGRIRKSISLAIVSIHFLAFWFFLVWKSVTSPTSRDSSTSRTWIDQLPRVLATFPVLCIRIYWMEKRRSLSKQFESISVDHIDIVYDWAKNYWPNYWSIK